MGEQAAVVGIDLHRRMTLVHGIEQAAELLPARDLNEARGLRVEGALQHLGWQQPGVLAKADEEAPVKDLLGQRQQPIQVDVLGRAVAGRIVRPQLVEQVDAQVPEEDVERLGDAFFFDMGIGGQPLDGALDARLESKQSLLTEQEAEGPQPL